MHKDFIPSVTPAGAATCEENSASCEHTPLYDCDNGPRLSTTSILVEVSGFCGYVKHPSATGWERE